MRVYDEYYEIYQYYIISEYGYQFLADHTDEIVFYNERLDVYIWGNYPFWYQLGLCSYRCKTY